MLGEVVGRMGEEGNRKSIAALNPTTRTACKGDRLVGVSADLGAFVIVADVLGLRRE